MHDFSETNAVNYYFVRCPNKLHYTGIPETTRDLVIDTI